MTATVRFPSPEFPAPPQVTVQFPDTWTAAQPAGAVIAMVRPAPIKAFAPNVFVSITRFGSEHSLRTTIDALRAKVDSYAEHAWGKESSTATESSSDYAVEVSYTDPTAGTLLQLHHFVLLDRGSAKDLVHAVGVCTAEQVEAVLPELRAVLASLEVSA